METISIGMSDGTIVIGTYKRPKYKFTKNDLNIIMGVGNKVITIGNFNATHPAWHCRRANPSGNMIYKYLLGERDF